MSVKISCTVNGVKELQQTMQSFDQALQRNVQSQLASWAADVKAEATRKAPVRTGYLRSTIYAKVNDCVVQLGAEAGYALFVELGTRYMLAQPYLWPAIQEYLPQLEKIVIDAIETAKREVAP
jgi:HK97 gp10 family phage protein